MRQDCCGISPTFLCLRSSSGWDCPKRYSKLIQSTVTAQKCFAFHSIYKLHDRFIASYHHQSPVEGHLVEDEPWQQSGHCRRTPCWGWGRTADWTEISTVEADAALCSGPGPEWWKLEEAVSRCGLVCAMYSILRTDSSIHVIKLNVRVFMIQVL